MWLADNAVMPDLLSALVEQRRLGHERLLGAVHDLTDEQLRWRPGPHAPAIGFHLFHVSRWADRDRSIIGGGEEIWAEKKLASSWELQSADLGDTGTGMGIGDEASEQLVLPPQEQLVAYAEEVFSALDAFIATVNAERLSQMTRPPDLERRTVQESIFGHLAHDNRHLGMIEALRGVLGLRGSATL